MRASAATHGLTLGCCWRCSLSTAGSQLIVGQKLLPTADLSGPCQKVVSLTFESHQVSLARKFGGVIAAQAFMKTTRGVASVAGFSARPEGFS